MAAGEIIVAIDFGTTYTGVSWTQYPTDAPGEIHLINTWKNPTFSNSNNDKVPSEIVYRDRGPAEWGFYPKANQPSLPIRWFKVLLDEEHMQEGLERDEILEGTKQYLESVGKSAEDVVADYLRLVWEYSFKEIQNKYLTDINQSFTFRIVITVPAIWNPEAREKTKRAISLAGLPKNSVVQAVEEPTAAAIATLNHLMRSEPNSIQQGDCYLVCDAGGGTVDLISYEVRSTEPLQIEPIAKADGRVCGSILLDQRFHSYMKKRIGPEIFDKLSTRKKAKMMTSFENHVKRRFKYHLKGDGYYSVELSGVPKGEGIDTEEGLIYLSPDILRVIFDSVCLNIFDLIHYQKLLVENLGKKIKAILLVGGFGMSIYLKEFLEAKCGPHMRFFQPMYGLTAVCRGAAIWGLEKSKAAAGEGHIYTVPSSITHYNYGVIDTEPMLWDSNNPDHQNSIKEQDDITGEWVVKNQMKWLLRYGDRLYFDRIETVRLSDHFLVERDWKSFFPKDVTFTKVLYYSKLEKAPFQYSPKTVSALCKVEVKIPGSKVRREKVFVKNHKNWYRVEYDLRLELGHNNLIFRLQYGDHEYGKVTQELKEPFRGPSTYMNQGRQTEAKAPEKLVVETRRPPDALIRTYNRALERDDQNKDEQVDATHHKSTGHDSSGQTLSKRWLLISDILEYLRLEYPSGQALGQVMVIYGGEHDACCTDCETFLARSAPPDLVSAVLDVLGRASSSPDLDQSCFATLGDNRWVDLLLRPVRNMTAKRNDLLFLVKTNSLSLSHAVEKLLISLATALQQKVPGGQDLSVSKATSSEVNDTVQITLEPLEPFSPSSCWHALFPGKAVAYASVEHPADMKGLEIPFDLMTELCGSDVPVSVDGGLCILGVFTLLVPIKVSTCNGSADCLQWHLICVPPPEASVGTMRKRPSVRTMRKRLWQLWADEGPKEWLKAENLEDLSKFKRHFLGWCQQSTITLGTREQSYDLKRSNAQRKDREATESSTTLNLGFAAHGIGFSGGRTIKRGRTERNPFENRERNLTSWLDSSMTEQILLYCPGRQQAWLVPQISALLHLVLAYMKRLHSRHREFVFNYPYCIANSSTPENAFQTLYTRLEDRLPEAGTEEEYKLKHLLITYLYSMDSVSRATRAARFSQRIFGFEALDIIKQPKYFRLKEGNASDHTIFPGSLGGWVKLLEEVDVILFVEGIKDPIIPAITSTSSNKNPPCKHWTRMPPDKNYLASTIASLRCLWEDSTGGNWHQLTNNTYWHCEKKLFGRCNCHRWGRCQRLQAIWTSDNAIPPNTTELEEFPEGAVIFASGTGLSDGLFI